jgi:LysM repeat protein
MTIRPLSFSIVGALVLVSAVASTISSRAQTNAAPEPSTNAAPAAVEPAPAAPAPADAASTERPTSYTMVSGDSLASVAKKFDTSIHELAKLNKIPKDKYRKLKTGTVLQIPPAKVETTK